MPLLSIEDLQELFDNDKISDNLDRQIAEFILAERDWIITIHNLNDFLIVLEREIDGETTKENLEKLLTKYNNNIEKYTWEANSVSILLEIFDLTEDKNLRVIFFKFYSRVNT